MLDHGRVNGTKLVIDVDITLYPSVGVLELDWSECISEGKRENKTRLTYRNACAWDRKDTGETGPRQCPTHVPAMRRFSPLRYAESRL